MNYKGELIKLSNRQYTEHASVQHNSHKETQKDQTWENNGKRGIAALGIPPNQENSQRTKGLQLCSMAANATPCVMPYRHAHAQPKHAVETQLAGMQMLNSLTLANPQPIGIQTNPWAGA
jgi:hypothetical protein